MISFQRLLSHLLAKSQFRIAAAALLVGFLFGQDALAEPVEVIASDRFALKLGSTKVELLVFSSRVAQEMQPDVTRLVIGLHGATRRADVVFNALRHGAERSGLADSTWILAPQFLYRHDLDSLGNPPEVPVWRSLGWVKGDDTRDPENWANSRAGTSSYALLDELILTAVDRSPKLREIIIAGHSAGGQMVQRYAATTRIADRFASGSTQSIRFLIANPAGYLYFDKRRPDLSGKSGFAIPDEAAREACPGFNDWHWGLDDRNGYVASKDACVIRQQYLSAEVLLIAGAADTVVNEDAVSGSCEAMLQGANRLERARFYHEYITDLQAKCSLGPHGFAEVDSTGHKARQMLNSQAAVEFLFRTEDVTVSGESE